MEIVAFIVVTEQKNVRRYKREIKIAVDKKLKINKIKKCAEQSIYANRRQSPTRKANAGGGMRRCKRWRRLCELSQSDARKIGKGNTERQPAGISSGANRL